MRIKVAVVGAGKIGLRHCRYYAQHAQVQLAAVCDWNEQLAKAAGEAFHVRSYHDFKQLLDREEVDLVSVATGGFENGSHHYEPVMLAIEAGKDVLVEKPISNQLAEARDMVRFALEKGVRLACNLNHRFAPAAGRAKELIDTGKLGDMLFLNMKLTLGSGKSGSPWLHMRALHPHSIDVMRYYAGDVRRVQAFMTQAPGRSMWSTVSINMEFVSGALGHLTGSYDMSNHHPFEFCEVGGTKGRLTVDNVFERLTFFPHDSPESIVYRNSALNGIAGFHETFRSRIEHLIGEIAAGVPPESIAGSGTEALAAQEVIEAAIASQLNDGAVVNLASSSTEPPNPL